jgi:ABC-type phosphate/phosphonate transport system ATPase subunit
MKKKQKVLRGIFIGLLTLASWYFFLKKYTYEFEMNTTLDEISLVEMLTTTYPATHPDLVLVEILDHNKYVFRYRDDGVSFFQEIRIIEENLSNRKLLIGVNAETNVVKERFSRFYKETLVQVFNQFLLLQLEKQIIKKEKLIP